jgi:hypothetical protein
MDIDRRINRPSGASVQCEQTMPSGVAAHPLTLATQKSACCSSQSPVASQRLAALW